MLQLHDDKERSPRQTACNVQESLLDVNILILKKRLTMGGKCGTILLLFFIFSRTEKELAYIQARCRKNL